MLSWLQSLSPVQTAFWWVLIAALAVQLFYYFFFFIRLILIKEGQIPTSSEGVSVVTCARNEEDNLIENVPLIMDQDYPEFELIIVNDNSWDATEEILEAFKVKYKNLKVVHLDEQKHRMCGKKIALTLGIKAASYEKVLLTDADCKPCSNRWIAEMTKHLNERSDIVLGFSPYKKEKGLLNRLIRFDAFTIGVQYISFAQAGTPYMGVGRNMAYKKSTFFSVGGFKKHYSIASGDDDLFVQQVASKKNTAVSYNPESQTVSSPKRSWKEWVRQKRRHMTTSGHYRFLHKVLLTIFPFSYYTFIIALIALLAMQVNPIVIISILALRLIVQVSILFGSARRMNQTDLAFFAPVWELLLMLIQPLILLSNSINKPKQWN
jgi:cellulose synthase/poly-beta-1,6-N-acetylglucosamine synthase-like glycosyltransferase